MNKVQSLLVGGVSLVLRHPSSKLSSSSSSLLRIRDLSVISSRRLSMSSRNEQGNTSKPSPSTSPAEGDKDVIFEEINGKGVITLNRPRALNALNLPMAKKIFPVLKEWEAGNKQFVIIKGTGEKAFCAGGDIKAVTDSASGGSPLYQEFFRYEYQLNNLIGTLQIPYIALIDGITMGGGVGLSVHGPYRVATERTLFAMPETAIGLFPDVGGGYFLPRLGGKLGLYLALTGYRLKGGDTLKSGVATHMCSSHMISALEQDLISLDSREAQDIEKVLNKYHTQCPEVNKPFTLESQMNDINSSFSAKTVEEILSNLQKLGTPWAQTTLETLGKMSPTSLKITMRLIETGANLDLQEDLQIEYRLSQRCAEDHDFREGVRALLIDKDQNPKWKPSRLEDVSEERVESYFAPLPEDRELIL